MGLIDDPIWGPVPYAPFQFPLGPSPPHKAEADNFEWGVGEEADLITLQPIWDPAETEWSYRNHIWNFIPEVRPHFTPENGNADGFDHPGFPTIPRRVFINTVVRFSKRMLILARYFECSACRCTMTLGQSEEQRKFTGACFVRADRPLETRHRRA